jgi:SAM-dependent methyltransferase
MEDRGVHSGLDDAREAWDRIFARSAAALRDAPPERDLSDIVARLRASSIVDVLDLGCGFGSWTISLARAGFRVLAVDVSPEAVGIVRRLAEREHLPMTAVVCAAQHLASLGTQVDGIVCNSVLDHMRPADAEMAVTGIASILKPGGLAYVTFDGAELDDAGSASSADHRVHADGTWEYVTGPRLGMIWRVYEDSEIRHLFRRFEEVAFAAAVSGQRRAWFRRCGLGDR